MTQAHSESQLQLQNSCLAFEERSERQSVNIVIAIYIHILISEFQTLWHLHLQTIISIVHDPKSWFLLFAFLCFATSTFSYLCHIDYKQLSNSSTYPKVMCIAHLLTMHKGEKLSTMWEKPDPSIIVGILFAKHLTISKMVKTFGYQ